MTRYLLAVDGGATKTTLHVSANDNVIFSATASGSNYQAIGATNVQQLLTTLLRQAGETIPQQLITTAVFGIAGIDTQNDLNIVTQIVQASIADSPLHIQNLFIENDVEATLYGISREPASLLISGTGALCCTFDGQQMIRAGGWGHRIGDEGSGYWIGQQIARAIMRAYDGRGEPTLLTDLVLQHLQFEQTTELIDWIYRSDYTNARLASLSQHLAPAIAQNDATAKLIAQQAAKELSLLVLSNLRRANSQNTHHTIFLNGGILKHNPFIYETLTAIVLSAFPNVHFKVCQLQPIDYITKSAVNRS